MELKNAIISLLDCVSDEGMLMYFYALLRKATSSIETEAVLNEILMFFPTGESNQSHAVSYLEAV